MKILNEKSWKGFLLLSVVIPMSFLAVFKLTGFIGDFSTTTQMSLPTKEWVFQRPYPARCLTIGEWLNTTYDDNEISLSVSLFFYDYETVSVNHMVHGDEIEFGVFINASTSANYHIDGVETLCGNDTQRSSVSHQFSFLEMENLTLVYHDAPPVLTDSRQATLKTAAVNRPNSVYFKTVNDWFLYDNMPEAKAHVLQVIVKLEYIDGFLRKSIIQCINMKVCANQT